LRRKALLIAPELLKGGQKLRAIFDRASFSAHQRFFWLLFFRFGKKSNKEENGCFTFL
jgi:hypothetical protein